MRAFITGMGLSTLTLIPLLDAKGAAAQEPLTNVEIRMVKSSSSGPLRVTAETRNPNDFAVRDVEMSCTIKDRRGNDLVSYRSTVLNVFQPNERTTTKSLSVGAWPSQGYAALCISTTAIRVPSTTAPQ